MLPAGGREDTPLAEELRTSRLVFFFPPPQGNTTVAQASVPTSPDKGPYLRKQERARCPNFDRGCSKAMVCKHPQTSWGQSPFALQVDQKKKIKQIAQLHLHFRTARGKGLDVLAKYPMTILILFHLFEIRSLVARTSSRGCP